MADENWERTMIERLATEGLLEQQRARRWGIFFKLLGFACVFLVLFLICWHRSAPASAAASTSALPLSSFEESSIAMGARVPTMSSPGCRPRSRTRERRVSC